MNDKIDDLLRVIESMRMDLSEAHSALLTAQREKLKTTRKSVVSCYQAYSEVFDRVAFILTKTECLEYQLKQLKTQ